MYYGQSSKLFDNYANISFQIRRNRWHLNRKCYIKIFHTRFISSLMNYLFKKLDKNIQTEAPHKHQSLQEEHGIKSLSTIFTKHLRDLDQMWPKYLPLATLAYNTSNTPNLANYSMNELVFSRKPKLLLDLETKPDIKVSGTFKD